MKLAQKSVASQPQRVVPTHSDRLHDIARRIERLGISGRTDPEQIVLGKLEIASELRVLARGLR
jgi:hypothetical protein